MKAAASIFTIICLLVLITTSGFAQQPAQPRPSPKAGVSQTIGLNTDISVTYGRPGVKGRKIWGDVVPFGLAPGNNYSKNNPFPWRGGANEATVVTFSKDVEVEGQKLPAGSYSLHFIPSEKEWVVIFNKNSKLWGSYLYNKDEDALRVTVTPVKAPFQEWLIYRFDNYTGTSAILYLHWVELKVPVIISVAK